MALFGRDRRFGECLLLREERKSGLRGPISVFDPGCVKTRRRSIAIEQVTRSRPFHVPTSQAHSILKSKSRISFSSRFELLSFHTAWRPTHTGHRRPKSATGTCWSPELWGDCGSCELGGIA